MKIPGVGWLFSKGTSTAAHAAPAAAAPKAAGSMAKTAAQAGKTEKMELNVSMGLLTMMRSMHWMEGALETIAAEERFMSQTLEKAADIQQAFRTFNKQTMMDLARWEAIKRTGQMGVHAGQVELLIKEYLRKYGTSPENTVALKEAASAIATEIGNMMKAMG